MSRRFWVAVLACAAGVGACQRRESPTAPSPTTAITYSALAASDGVGFGGTMPCVVFDPDCPSGTGYVYVIKRRLQTDGRTVMLANLSVPGAVLSPAMQGLLRDIGRDPLTTLFDQSTVVLSASTHVTIFTGGNDANAIAQNVRAGRGSADVRAFIDQQVNQFGVDLLELVRRIRSRAATARIVAFNLPNLAAAPYVASLSVQERSVLQRIAVGLSDRINALASQNVLVVDLMCDSRMYEGASFSADGFHPSDRGYSLMAEVAYPAVATGASSAPSSSCPQRTLFPVF